MIFHPGLTHGFSGPAPCKHISTLPQFVRASKNDTLEGRRVVPGKRSLHPTVTPPTFPRYPRFSHHVRNILLYIESMLSRSGLFTQQENHNRTKHRRRSSQSIHVDFPRQRPADQLCRQGKHGSDAVALSSYILRRDTSFSIWKSVTLTASLSTTTRSSLLHSLSENQCFWRSARSLPSWPVNLRPSLSLPLPASSPLLPVTSSLSSTAANPLLLTWTLLLPYWTRQLHRTSKRSQTRLQSCEAKNLWKLMTGDER
jgi:hypothetical protein